ncbi:MAG: translation initiation factor IF-3 [bacterium]|nr:translation initiation factor IF-3 [bacterium]
MNERIYFPEMRVVTGEGEMLGIISKEDALKEAKGRGLDLVIIADKAIPPVAKIIDYGKYIYEQEKQKKKNKKKQKNVSLKEIQLKPNIDVHDLEVKMKNLRKFIDNKDKVKVVMRFFGRQRLHTEKGREILEKVVKMNEDICDVEERSPLSGNSMLLMLVPKK